MYKNLYILLWKVVTKNASDTQLRCPSDTGERLRFSPTFPVLGEIQCMLYSLCGGCDLFIIPIVFIFLVFPIFHTEPISLDMDLSEF